ncbi:hypothetical protein [Mesorhizobium sp. dw_380]|uniref:hypothetical protein n=1 Tax=Mesorhizobium sp. dw_380 TaxID=2812001 RepID=UPI001BDEFBBE|nr:hypothetical protein [Mesorhizobium sp. dw_380]
MERQSFSPITSTPAADTSDLALDRLLRPASHFNHPDEVLSDETLDLQEKRAILSSWASDACAVHSMPALRQPPGASQPVSFDQIMDALFKLDGDVSAPRQAAGEFTHLFDRLGA